MTGKREDPCTLRGIRFLAQRGTGIAGGMQLLLERESGERLQAVYSAADSPVPLYIILVEKDSYGVMRQW